MWYALLGCERREPRDGRLCLSRAQCHREDAAECSGARRRVTEHERGDGGRAVRCGGEAPWSKLAHPLLVEWVACGVGLQVVVCRSKWVAKLRERIGFEIRKCAPLLGSKRGAVSTFEPRKGRILHFEAKARLWLLLLLLEQKQKLGVPVSA